MSSPKAKRRKLDEDARRRLGELEAEELGKPIPWFKHDSDSHADPKMALLLVEEDGYALYGMFWLLVERLAAREGHGYRLQTGADWIVLARDLLMFPGDPEAMALLHRFVDLLVELDLADADVYAETGMLTSERLWRNCAEVSRGRASRRYAGEVTARMRWEGR